MYYSYSASGDPSVVPKVAGILGIGFLLIGIIVLIVALVIMLYKSSNEKACTVKTRGQIVNDFYTIQHSNKYDYNGGIPLDMYMFTPCHYLTIMYWCEGLQVTSHRCVHGYKSMYHNGQNIDIWYNPANPTDYRVKNKMKNIVCLCLLILGISFTIFGLVALVLSKGVKL